MADTKQCKNCAYWKSVYGTNNLPGYHFCHHLLITDRRRVEVDGVCKSWTLRTNGTRHIERDYYKGDEEV